MKIVLVGVPLKHRSFNGANKALPVLAHALYMGGFENAIQLDLERPDLTIWEVLREVADTNLVAFCGCLSPQWPEIDAIGQMVYYYLVKLGRAHVPIIVGGYAAKSAQDILEETPWITALFDGEGEEGIVEITRAVERGTFHEAKRNIHGLCFIDETGKYRRSIAPRVRNLNPYNQNFGLVYVPSVHDMDIFLTPDGRQLRTGQVFDQRGCPWACGFCNKSQESPNVVWLSDEAFRQQLRWLKERVGAEAVYLDVDTATVNREKFLRHAQVIHEERLVWGTNTRIDAIDLELMQFAAKSGCVYIFFGVEHLNPGVLVAINKFNGSLPVQLQRATEYPNLAKRVFQGMKRAGLPSSYFMLLGLPKVILNESCSIVKYEPASFEDDIATAFFGLDECETDFFNFNILRFMPGSTAGDVLNHPAFSVVRPSGNNPITGGWFLPRVARKRGYNVPKNHGVYRLCESVGHNQPASIGLDAQQIYDTVLRTVDHINARIDRGMKPTKLFIDRELLRLGLVKHLENGGYWLAPFKEFEAL